MTGVLTFDGAEYGFADGAPLLVTAHTPAGPGTAVEKPGSFDLPLELPPYAAIAHVVAERDRQTP